MQALRRRLNLCANLFPPTAFGVFEPLDTVALTARLSREHSAAIFVTPGAVLGSSAAGSHQDEAGGTAPTEPFSIGIENGIGFPLRTICFVQTYRLKGPLRRGIAARNSPNGLLAAMRSLDCPRAYLILGGSLSKPMPA
jgi:hypothetical protein